MEVFSGCKFFDFCNTPHLFFCFSHFVYTLHQVYPGKLLVLLFSYSSRISIGYHSGENQVRMIPELTDKVLAGLCDEDDEF